MFQLQGWVVLHNTTDGNDDFAYLESIADSIREVDSILDTPDAVSFEVREGFHVMSVNLVRNHEAGTIGLTETLLERIGKQAPGSYGVLHFRDSDFAPGNFHRLVMRRGVTTGDDDDLFNPVVPTIEDP